MKTFNNFVTTATLLSAMAISLVAFQNTATAEDAIKDNTSTSNQMMDANKPAMPADSQAPIPSENDKMVMEDQMKTDGNTKPMMDSDNAPTSMDNDKPAMNNAMDQSSTDDSKMPAEDDKPWYKKWLEKLGM